MRSTRPFTVPLVAALAAGSLLIASPPTLAASEPSAPAALMWLEAQLNDNGGTLPSTFGGTDWGLTSDAILALSAGGRGSGPAATAATAAFADAISNGDYISGEAFGDEGSAYAGAIGKSMLTVALQGEDVNSFGGVDLEAKARSAMQTSGMFEGRFSDVSSFGDFSNGFGQAYNTLALARTPGGVPTSAIDFLLDQQCPGGGFRLSYQNTRGCESDDEASIDTTGLTLQALTVLPESNARSEAIARATAWLLAAQDPATGGFGTSPDAAPNANSTGLAAHGLNAVGATPAASVAAEFIGTLQLDAVAVDGTAAAGEVGAIAFDIGAFEGALTSGITDDGRDQWRRATTQGVLALGLAPYGDPVGPIVPVQPARLLDTRPGAFTVDGQQVGTGLVQPGSPVELQITGRGGVPTGADAAVLNLTVDGAQSVGFVTAYPCDASMPEASNLNFTPGAPTANAAIVKLSATGTVCLSVSEPVFLIADINGFVPVGAAYGALQPARLLDTRPGAFTIDGQQVGAGLVQPGTPLVLQIAGRGGVPTGADAAVLNLTVDGAENIGFVTAYPCDASMPEASTLNFAPGAPIANAAILKLSDTGTVCLSVSEPVFLIADVNGYSG